MPEACCDAPVFEGGPLLIPGLGRGTNFDESQHVASFFCRQMVPASHAGVTLGRFQRFMPHHGLNVPDIRTISQHQRGTGMPKGMRCDPLADPGQAGIPVNTTICRAIS